MNNEENLQNISARLRERAQELLRSSSLQAGERDRILTSILDDMGVYEHELETQNAELVKTRDQLRQALERYHQFFESAPAAHIAVRSDGAIVDANRAAAALFGTHPSGLVERSVQELVHEPLSPSLTDKRRSIVTLRGGTSARVLLDVQPVVDEEVSYQLTLIPLEADDGAGSAAHATDAETLARRTAELDAANRSLRNEVRTRDAVERRIRDSQTRLRALAERLSRVEEDQRRKLATELHNLIGQTLIAANMKLALLEHDVDAPEMRAQIQDVRATVRDMVETARGIITELRPPVLDEQDFETAMQWLSHLMADRYGLTVETDLRCDARVPDLGMKEFLFRATRELLRNAARHSGSDTVRLRVELTSESVAVDVLDQGEGFDVTSLDGHEGFGLFEIRERIEAFGGEFTLESGTGTGTTVSIFIPLTPPQT